MAGLEELSREELIALVERLLESNAKLEERVRRLERQVSRNSGNSSLPPSTDDLPGRAMPVAKPVKQAGRKRGKQKGAPGSAMSWAVPDETVPHRPSGNCGCGADLAFAEDLGVERSHQVHDLPEVRLQVWQHDVHRVRCACGTEHLGSLPDGVPDASPELWAESAVIGCVSACLSPRSGATLCPADRRSHRREGPV